MNFALIGAAGFVAPRHMRAIKETGNRLVAAADPHDSVGILDSYFREVRYFPEIERFDRHLEKLRRGPEKDRIHAVSVCSPNYLHDAHVRLALRVGARAVCEKPLVINPWNLDQLEAIEKETGGRIDAILQLRLHERVQKLKAELDEKGAAKRHRVSLTYITGRGPWYQASWKGAEDRSGGVVMNIGVHFFDVLTWLFGSCDKVEVSLREPTKVKGKLILDRADVDWFLSVDCKDLPDPGGAATTYRCLSVDDEIIDLSRGFDDLHTAMYERILAGHGFGIEDARPSIELVHRVRTCEVVGG